VNAATPADPGGKLASTRRAGDFEPGAAQADEDPAGTDWTITDDVLRRTTTCSVRHGADYETPHGGHAWEEYEGHVTVDRRTSNQQAQADCTYRLTWPGVDVRVTSTMRVELKDGELEVHIDVDAFDKEYRVARRDWSERFGP
jgi:hypothetical protein